MFFYCFLGRSNGTAATLSNDKISSNVKLGLRSNKRAQRPATYAADIDVPVKLLYEVSNLGACILELFL